MPTPPTSPVQRVAVLGARGMLGRAWCELLEREGVEHTPLDLPEFDLCNPDHLRARLASGGHTHAINAAGWTDVDGAETHEPEAAAVNAEAVALLAKVCADSGTHILHYSTDYVFAGDASTPYRVDAPHRPINAYGRTKSAGEHALADSAARWTIVRTSWVYAPWGRNFVLTIADLLGRKDRLRVVNDQRGRPTCARHLARTSLALLERSLTGTWHITDGGACTWHGLAEAIARRIGSACPVEPCTSAEFPRPAARPAYSVLDLSRTEETLGPMPAWEHNLAAVLADIPLRTKGTP